MKFEDNSREIKGACLTLWTAHNEIHDTKTNKFVLDKLMNDPEWEAHDVQGKYLINFLKARVYSNKLETEYWT